MSCEDEVPWIEGKPDRLIDLDDEQELQQNNIILDAGLRRGDCYIHFRSCRWYVIERTDGRVRFEYKISQIRSTVEQLLKRNSCKVDGCVLVADRIHPNERLMYGVDKKNKEIFLKNSTNKKRVDIYGMALQFYTTDEVDNLKGN